LQLLENQAKQSIAFKDSSAAEREKTRERASEWETKQGECERT